MSEVGADREVYPLDDRLRQRAIRLGLVQGVLMTCGQWLLGGWFLSFFAMELGAQGTMLGIVLAVANVAGILRIFAPTFVNRCDNRKQVWMVATILARVAAMGLPVLAFPQFRPKGIDPVWLLVLIQSGNTIANAISEVAWLSWYADVIPEKVWGRYFGRRNAYMAVPIGVVPLLGGWAVDTYARMHPESKLVGYAVVYGLGILCHLLAVIPLLSVPNLKLRRRQVDASTWGEILQPFRDPNFRRYAYFYCWLMLTSGIPQAAFNLYLKNYLLLGLLQVGSFQLVNQVTSLLGSRWAGGLSDRFGNKPIIILGLIGAATGPFFWLPTDRSTYWWIYGAYTVWGLGWAWVNLGSQNLMLKVAPQGNNVAYIAAAQGVGGMCLAICQILGGWWLEHLMNAGFTFNLGWGPLTAYHLFFLYSFVGRSSAALWVFAIREPRCRSIPYMFRTLRRAWSRR